MILTDRQFKAPQVMAKREFKLTANQRILLMPVGDVHAYSEHWPKERFKDHIQWGIDRGAYFLGMGEYFDFTSGSQRAILGALRPSQKATLDGFVKERVEEFAELIKGSKGNWLGMLEGHHYHEYVNGITSDQHLCQLMDCPFLGTSTLYDLRFNDSARGHEHGATVTIYAHHGCGGGRKQGGHLHRVEDLIVGIEADIYLMGHSHSKANAPLDRLYRTRDGHLYHRTKLIARTGAFLRGYAGKAPMSTKIPAAESRGSYVEFSAMTPSALGGMVIGLGYKRVRYTNDRGKEISIHVPEIHYSV